MMRSRLWRKINCRSSDTEKQAGEAAQEAAAKADDAGLPEPIAEAIEDAKDLPEAAEATAAANDTKDNEATAEESQNLLRKLWSTRGRH